MLPNPFYSQRAKPMSRKPLHNAKTPVIPDQAAAMEDQDKPVAISLAPEAIRAI
jgi:hypothetical protein